MKKLIKITRLILIVSVFLFPLRKALGQDINSQLDPKWAKYYGDDPAGINTHHQGTDFIQVAKMVSFEPIKDLKDPKIGSGNRFLQFLFLNYSQKALNQFRIDGEIMSQTYKHDDYFNLYNMYYKKISKGTWDKYAPYLIVLMVADGLITDS